MLADIVYGFQQTGVVPAIPAVQADFGASREWSTWLLSGYLIVASVTPVFLGKLADRSGKRRVYLGALAVFLAGSVLAALAPSIGVLVAGRLVQGAGGAVFPLSFALLRDHLPANRVSTGIGVLTGGFGIGALAGFALGGLLTETLSWRWLFWVGAGALAAAALAVRLTLPESATRTSRGLDVPGAALFGAAMAALVIALTEGPQRGWSAPLVVGMFALAVAAAAGWVVRELRTSEPLVQLRVLGSRPVLLANLASLLGGYAVLGVNVLVPFLMQRAGAGTALGLSAGPLLTGLVLVPRALGQSVGGPVTGPLARRIGPARAFAGGMVLLVAALLGLALWRGQLWMILVELGALGAGFGVITSMGGAIVTMTVARTETGVASGINSVLRRVGGAVGAQVGTALLAAATLPGSGEPSPHAFTLAFLVAAAVAGAGACCAFFVTTGQRV